MVLGSLVTRANASSTIQHAVTHALTVRPSAAIANRVASSHLLLSRWGLEHMMADAAARESFDAATREMIREKVTEANRALLAAVPIVQLTSVESAVLDTPLGEVPASTLAALEGRWESLGVATWALGLIPTMPAYYTRFDMPQVLSAARISPSHPASIAAFLEAAEMGRVPVRPDAELTHALNASEAWYWRARAQVLLALKEAVDDPSCDSADARKLPKALRDMAGRIDVSIQYAATRSLNDNLITKSLNGDFAIPDTSSAPPTPTTTAGDSTTKAEVTAWKPYSLATETEWDRMKLISENRLASFGWLLSDRDWDVSRDEVGFVNHMSSIWQPEQES
ncbi:hypothetical protein BC828DRAFT_383261 [Blastocladiella britannica]|nr:hypothetical protein BC828DRAFT_383261 [Blastocladiella britannica]